MVGRAALAGSQHQQELAAFAIHTHRMHLTHSMKGEQSLPDIQHGREFHHHHTGAGEKGRREGCHIGRTIAQSHHLAADIVAAGGIEEDKILLACPIQKVLGLSTLHPGMSGTKQRQIVLCHFTKVGVALHINGITEQRGEKTEIHAEATRKVGQRTTLHGQQTLHQTGFVLGCQLAAALLHIEAGRKEDTVGGCPAGQLGASSLPSLYLTKAEGLVNTCICTTQSERTHIIRAMGENVFAIVHLSFSLYIL